MKHKRGFSMVELMVAITLALLVTTAVLSVFVGSRTAYQSTTGTSALSDGGRFALGYLQTAVRGSGYLACGPSTRVASMLNPGPTPLAYGFGASGYFQPLSGFEAANTGIGGTYTLGTSAGSPANWTPTLDSALPPASTTVGALVANSDILVVRSSTINKATAYVTAIAPSSSSFTINSLTTLTTVGQLGIISDCSKSMLFQVSGIASAGTSAIITHAAGGSPGNTSSVFNISGTSIDFPQGAQVSPLDTVIYYIGTGSDGDNSLFSYELQPNNTFVINELVPDIEAMQILYGWDSSGTLAVGEYITADQVPDFTTILSVKIALLAASPPGSAQRPAIAPAFSLLGTSVTAPRDTRKRQVFEITVGARNALT